MQTTRRMFLLPILALLYACDGSSPANESRSVAAVQETAADTDTEQLPAFVGKIWASTTPRSALGAILVFLPNKTVLRDSCFETYRVSQWGIISDSRIRWVEDMIPIEAEYRQPSPDELVLEPVGTGTQEYYVAMSEPYVCPDMPR